MKLDLNSIVVPYEGNKYYGRNIDKMPELIADGRIPISVSGVMDCRLNSGKKDWKNNYFDTGDAILYHPDGKFKIVRDAKLLRDLTPESTLKNGALILADGHYETVQGAEFTRKDLKTILERELSAAEVKAHPLWKGLVPDESLLHTYVDAMFPEMKQRFGYAEAMGIYLASGEKVPTLRAAHVWRLGNGSQLYGGDWLDCVGGRLVGVAPEALRATQK